MTYCNRSAGEEEGTLLLSNLEVNHSLTHPLNKPPCFASRFLQRVKANVWEDMTSTGKDRDKVAQCLRDAVKGKYPPVVPERNEENMRERHDGRDDDGFLNGFHPIPVEGDLSALEPGWRRQKSKHYNFGGCSDK